MKGSHQTRELKIEALRGFNFSRIRAVDLHWRTEPSSWAATGSAENWHEGRVEHLQSLHWPDHSTRKSSVSRRRELEAKRRF